MSVGVKIERKDYSKERINNIHKNLADKLVRVGILVEAQAKENVSQSPPRHPQVDTGRLRGSITHIAESDNVKIGTNVIYGKYLEFGGESSVGIGSRGGRKMGSPFSIGIRKRPAYPWLFPALESRRGDIKKILGEKMK